MTCRRRTARALGQADAIDAPHAPDAADWPAGCDLRIRPPDRLRPLIFAPIGSEEPDVAVQQLALWDRPDQVAPLGASRRVAVNVGSDDRLRSFAAAHQATPARVVGILLDLLEDPGSHRRCCRPAASSGPAGVTAAGGKPDLALARWPSASGAVTLPAAFIATAAVGLAPPRW